MNKAYDYVVFDFFEAPQLGAVELQTKLDELGAQGYSIRETYYPRGDAVIRFIMQKEGSIVL